MSGKQSSMRDDHKPQTEALSAYLDDALDSAEREALERHLATCDACQAELADLRRVREMLRALPAPTVPRSFTLPTAPAPARPDRRSGAPSRAPAWTRAAQWLGGIAAAVGVGLLTLGALHAPNVSMGMAAPQRNTTSSFGGSTSAPAPGTPSFTDQATSSPGEARTPFAEGTNPAVGSGTVVTVATPTAPIVNSGEKSPPAVSVPGTESSSSPLLPAGATLLIGGGAAFVVGTTSRRRKRRPREQSR